VNSTTPDRKFSSLSVDEQRSIRGSCSELLSDGRLSFSSTVEGEAAAFYVRERKSSVRERKSSLTLSERRSSMNEGSGFATIEHVSKEIPRKSDLFDGALAFDMNIPDAPSGGLAGRDRRSSHESLDESDGSPSFPKSGPRPAAVKPTPFDQTRIGTYTRHGIAPKPGARGGKAKMNQDRGVVCWPYNGAENEVQLCARVACSL